MRRALVGLLLVALSTALGAQPPSFDVASVKPNKSGDARTRFALPPGRFAATNASVRDLIRMAYGLADSQVIALPGWAVEERFDLDATTRAPDASGPPLTLGPGGPPLRVLLMLRSLLTERFRLAAHTETREMPIYALVLARRDRTLGAGMAPSTIDCAALSAAALANPNAPPKAPRPGQPPKCGMFGVPGRFEGWFATLPELAQFLAPVVGRTVVDRTGLAGGFDFKIEFVPEPAFQDAAPAQPAPSGPFLAAALEEQLGLRLEATKGPVEVMIVDSVSRPAPD